MAKIVILGAGISGLSLGWYLKNQFKDSLDLTIVEASEKAGGWIKTIEKEDFLFELGPRSCRSFGNGIKTLQLIEELGLKAEVIAGDPLQKNRYIYKDEKLQLIPRGIVSFLNSPLKYSIFFALCRDFFLGKKTSEHIFQDESIEQFATRRFGGEIATSFFDPMTSGIYAGDMAKLSLKSCFPLFYEMEKAYGSILKGMFLRKSQNMEQLSPFVQEMSKNPLFSFKRGMQTLTDTLADQLKGSLLLSSEVTQIDISDSESTLYFKAKPRLVADYLFSTLPAQKLAQVVNLLPQKVILEKFYSTSVAVVNLGFKSQVIKKKGFGYLIPSCEQEEILGVVFDSTVFKEQNHLNKTRLTVMIGGAHFVNFEQYHEDDFLKIALKALKKHLSINAQPDVFHVEIARNAISQYLIGHEERVNAMQALMPPHFKILGSSFFGVSVNDCIAKSQSIACNFCN